MNIHWFWFEGPDKEPSVTLSFMIVSFIIVAFKLFFGGLTITTPVFTWAIQSIDAATIGAFLGVTFGSYVGRKYTDAKFVDRDNDGIDDREEAAQKAAAADKV